MYGVWFHSVVQKADVEVFFDEVERPPNLPRANMPGAAPGAQKACRVGWAGSSSHSSCRQPIWWQHWTAAVASSNSTGATQQVLYVVTDAAYLTLN